MSKFFDPDRRIFSKDKFQHAGVSLVIFLGLSFLAPLWLALVLTIVIGAVFEAGQWDAVRRTQYEGQVGYGFGLYDLGADTVGAFVGLALRLIIHG